MFTCGWRRSRPLMYASSSGSAVGMSVMLMLFVIESAVTAPRIGQLAVAAPMGDRPAGAGAAPAAGAVEPRPVAAALLSGQARVRRCCTIETSEIALE